MQRGSKTPRGVIWLRAPISASSETADRPSQPCESGAQNLSRSWRVLHRMTFVDHAPTPSDSPVAIRDANLFPLMTDAPITARRDAIVAQLGAAWAADAIDEAEMERRMSAAFAAREPADLERLIADLPAPSALVPLSGGAANTIAPRGPQLAPLRRVLLSSVEERVRSVVPARVEFGVRLGSVEMDFTEAIFAHAVTEIVVDVVLSNLELTFPADVAIESDVHGVLANVEQKDLYSRNPPSGRTVRVTGRAFLGNVEIRVAGGARED